MDWNCNWTKNKVQFQKSRKYLKYEDFVSARYSFYANRYDYLRIAKTMMDGDKVSRKPTK